MLVLKVIILSLFSTVIGTSTESNLFANTSVTVRFRTDVLNKTILSEGGAIQITDPPNLISLKDNHTLLLLDKELGKNKLKPVKARKGADLKDYYNATNEKTQALNINETEKNINSTEEIKPASIINNTEVISQNTPQIISPLGFKSGLKFLNKVNITSVMDTPKHTKPTVLSYEILSNMDDNNDLPPIQSSMKSLLSGQMPSPHKDQVTNKNIVPLPASSHPGMIMPVVITMLIVPMFAVLGFMALRRGKEAWKNRHYKRMDFLIDGMYND